MFVPRSIWGPTHIASCALLCEHTKPYSVANVANIFFQSVAPITINQVGVCNLVCFYVNEIVGWPVSIETWSMMCSEALLTTEHLKSLDKDQLNFFKMHSRAHKNV